MLVYITGVDRSAFEEQGDHIINLRIRCPVPTLDLNAAALTTRLTVDSYFGCPYEATIHCPSTRITARYKTLFNLDATV